MLSVLTSVLQRATKIIDIIRCWLFLRRRVTGRLKLRGNVRKITVHPSFRCDGDLWLGVYSSDGQITIEQDVAASGPLIVTAIRPLRIGAGTLFGPNVLITDHYHGNSRDSVHHSMPPSHRPLYSPGSINIEEEALFGANSVVLSPARIGRGAIVAANAVAKGNVTDMSIFTGRGANAALSGYSPSAKSRE